MKRRTLLSSILGGFAALSGCNQRATNPTTTPTSRPSETDGDSDGSSTSQSSDNDGYPSAPETAARSGTVAQSGTTTPGELRTVTYQGPEVQVSVPAASIDLVYYWYRQQEARFVDARSHTAYTQSHIRGAISSPAPEGGNEREPVDKWPKTDRIVCYCSCPHHLSAIRAAHLRRNGYENVYVLYEGFGEWKARGYPIAGSNVFASPNAYVINGRVGPRYTGRTAWVRHPPSEQMEATRIGDGGFYSLGFKFFKIDRSSRVVIETPAYRLTGKLDSFVDNLVTAPAVSSQSMSSS